MRNMKPFLFPKVTYLLMENLAKFVPLEVFLRSTEIRSYSGMERFQLAKFANQVLPCQRSI